MVKSGFYLELRPNRDLLDTSFGGYKLSLDSVPIYKKTIPEGVDLIQPNDDQYSFAHVKLFSQQNHLHVNPFSNSIYFIDRNWNVTKVLLNLLNKLEDLQVVWNIPSLQGDKKRLYNVTLSFVTADMVVLSDGAGTAHIISITTTDNTEKWELLSSPVLCDNKLGFLLSDVKLQETENQKLLHIIFMYIEQKADSDNEESNTGLFRTVIEWVTLIHGENWIEKSCKKLNVDGNVEYIALEPNCKALFIVGDKVPIFTYDSEKPVVQVKEEEVETSTDEKLYSWTQGEEEITLLLPVQDITKSDLSVNINSKSLQIKIKGEEILSGEFTNPVDKDLTSWSLEKDKLEIQLMKQESGQMWQNLLLNDKRGEQIFNPELVGQVHDQLAHLCSDKEVDSGQPSFNSQQLEDCDAVSCNTSVFVRMSAEKHSVTHEISLSSHQWLFKVQRAPKKIPALCLRHDVDACVWQFQKADDDEKDWPHRHVGTFFAFGYVQASKNQKKYIACPPDLSYVTVCETTRHIYLYRQPSPVDGELRNRTSGKKVATVSKQQLINLDSSETILGIHATNSLLYILTENTIHILTVNE